MIIPLVAGNIYVSVYRYSSSLPLLAVERLNGTHVESSSWPSHNGRPIFFWSGIYLIRKRGRTTGSCYVGRNLKKWKFRTHIKLGFPHRNSVQNRSSHHFKVLINTMINKHFYPIKHLPQSVSHYLPARIECIS